MDNPLNQQDLPLQQEDEPQFNITAGQARERIDAAIAFSKTEAYLDFEEEYKSIVTGADVVIDSTPDSFLSMVNREQAIGERRIANQVLVFFKDYIKTMQVTLDQINATLVATSEPENPQTTQE